MKKIFITILVIIAIFQYSYGQTFSNKVVGKKNEDYLDSLKKTEYPYLLPIWGKKVAEKGFSLPLSAGINLNYLWQKSDLIINNLYVGFNNGPEVNLDEIVRFNSATSEASAINLRPDIWLLPFLNVYGIFSKAKTSTSIDVGVWIPEGQDNWQEITTFSTKANFDATGVGFGITPTMGIGGGWLALDMNCVWMDIDALSKPVFTFVFDPRVGKSFNFKKPDRNISVWVGAFRLKLTSQTDGSMYLDEIIPIDVIQSKVDNGITKVGEAYNNVDEWWNGLTPVEQKNPVNKAKYEAANAALDRAGGFLTNIDNSLNDDNRVSVQYSLQKKPANMWNFLIGSQFQLNKNIMFRAEYGGIAGSRQQFIGGIQYRFGL